MRGVLLSLWGVLLSPCIVGFSLDAHASRRHAFGGRWYPLEIQHPLVVHDYSVRQQYTDSCLQFAFATAHRIGGCACRGTGHRHASATTLALIHMKNPCMHARNLYLYRTVLVRSCSEESGDPPLRSGHGVGTLCAELGCAAHYRGTRLQTHVPSLTHWPTVLGEV